MLRQLYDNNSRLSDQEALDRAYGPIVRFNHVSSKSSNWVVTAIVRL